MSETRTTVPQDFAEEEQEFQEGVNDVRFRQRVRGPALVRPAANTAEGIQTDAVLGCYAECLQLTLKVRRGCWLLWRGK